MKRALVALIAVLLTAGVVHLLTRPAPEAPPAPKAPQTAPTPQRPTPDAPQVPAPADSKRDDIIAPSLPKRDGRPFYGELPEGIKRLADLPMANRPSPRWRGNLESQIRRNGGTALSKMETKPQESYIIRDGEAGRYVERVVVTVHAKDGRFTRFFAEVDSESGHVLKTWGSVIHENPKFTE